MNVTEIVQSAGWKNFMAKLYGIGASVVILGALFKIQHIPGGGIMITAGLLVEAVIFFFSAFEPLHEELDWTLVYPELAGMTDPDELDEYKDEALASRGGVTLEKFDDLFKQADIQPETITKLGEGLSGLHKTAANIVDISNASVATQEYLTNIKAAADSVSTLTNNYSQSTNDLALSVSSLSDTYNKTAELISTSGKEIAQKFATSGSNLASSYTDLSSKLKSDYENISQGNKGFTDQLATLNKNLQELNSAYEHQIKGTTEHMKGSDEVYKGLEHMLKQLKSSVEETEKYKEEMSKLSKNLSDLNNIYGNMLTAMTVK
ncbi:MAG: gliding motility protein GldL [Bacteroidales bacterium]|nr:gliding motility protein GldL [Bacteroidales bacterium]